MKRTKLTVPAALAAAGLLMTAVAPASAIRWMPSGKGKKASEPTTVPASGSAALRAAIRQESTRLIWPAPMPTVWSTSAMTIAFDLT